MISAYAILRLALPAVGITLYQVLFNVADGSDREPAGE
jgi:hypothetical protein